MYLYLPHSLPPYPFSILFALMPFTFPFLLFFMTDSIINIMLNTQLQENNSEKYNLSFFNNYNIIININMLIIIDMKV